MIRWKLIKNEFNEFIYESTNCNVNDEYIRVTLYVSKDKNQIYYIVTAVVNDKNNFDIPSKRVNNRYNPQDAYMLIYYDGVTSTPCIKDYRYEYVPYTKQNVKLILNEIGRRLESCNRTSKIIEYVNVDAIRQDLKEKLQILNYKSYGNIYAVSVYKRGTDAIFHNVTKAKSYRDAIVKSLSAYNPAVDEVCLYKVDCDNQFVSCYNYQHKLDLQKNDYMFILYKFDTDKKEFVLSKQLYAALILR